MGYNDNSINDNNGSSTLIVCLRNIHQVTGDLQHKILTVESPDLVFSVGAYTANCKVLCGKDLAVTDD